MGMCPQWLVVVGIVHYSNKITTTTNSLISTTEQMLEHHGASLS